MKVPEPRKLPSGTYFIQLRLGGESVSISAPTRRECIQQAQLKKAEHRAGLRTAAVKSDQTPRQLMQTYIDHVRASSSPSTIRGYATICANRFPSVADVPFSSVANWQAVIDAEARTVSAKTLKNSWALFASALRHASLPVPDVRLPQLIRAERPWLEPEDVLKLVQLVHGKPYEIPTLLALHGLRRSEILALTFSNIDLSRNTITIHGAAVMDSSNRLVQKATNKNAASRRVIPIMIPALADAIRALPERPPDALIYTGNANTLYNQVNRLCRENALPEVGVHGLRHSFASLAFHLGLTEQETMELGGWSDYNTMRKIYTHLAQADRLKGHNKLAAFFSQPGDPAPR